MQPDTSRPNVARLAGRGVVSVGGDDCVRFLQGLVTASVGSAGSAGQAVCAGLLTPQGKIILEMIIVDSGRELLLDVPRDLAADLVKRLGFYKLRAKIEIADRSAELSVSAGWGETYRLDGLVTRADPRSPELGHRAIASDGMSSPTRAEADYHAHRIACGVPELGQDYLPGEVFPHEALYDQTGAVDFRKGCFIGQEVVSRMEHRGTARSRFVIVEGEAELPPRGTEVRTGDVPLGVMGSNAGNRGLALLRLDRLADAKAPLEAGGVRLAARKPPFARFDVPGVIP